MENGWERRRRLVGEDLERRTVELIAERGFHGVTINDLATTAGVSPRTLTRYFPTKEDVLLSLPRRALEALAAAMRAAPRTGAPVADIAGLWVQMTGDHDTELEYFRLWSRAANTAPEVIARMRGEYDAALVPELVARCAQELGVDPTRDIRPRAVAGLLVAVNVAAFEFWQEQGGEDDLGRVFAEAFEALREELASPCLARVLDRGRTAAAGG